jgi:hypothetical protein
MAVKSHTLGPGSLAIGAVGPRQFGAQLTKCLLSPSTTSEDDVHTLSGDVVLGEDTTVWELSGTLLQDYDLLSLEAYCFEHQGEILAFAFTPSDDHHQAWTGSVKIRPVAIGGDVKKKNSSDFKFPLQGDPTPVDTDDL